MKSPATGVFAQQQQLQPVSYAGIGAGGGLGVGGTSPSMNPVQMAQEFNRTLEEEVEAEGPNWGEARGMGGRRTVVQ